GLYREHLKVLPDWDMPFAEAIADSAAHLMVALAPNADKRNSAARSLRDLGIQTSLHYPCIPDFKAFAPWHTSTVERSREFAARAMTLPLFPTMTDAEVLEICNVLEQVS